MANIADLYAALINEIGALEGRYISRFIPANPAHQPEDFEYDVKSFCLLCHAAFEEYVEAVSELLMKKIESDFLGKKTTLATSLFLASYGIRIDLSDDEDADEVSCFEHMRGALSSAKQLHSRMIHDNHGFSTKYLRRLLIPVGLDMPSGPKVDSLKKLADARGSFAHAVSKLAMYGEYKKANKVLTPEEALEAARDCLEICAELRDRAAQIW